VANERSGDKLQIGLIGDRDPPVDGLEVELLFREAGYPTTFDLERDLDFSFAQIFGDATVFAEKGVVFLASQIEHHRRRSPVNKLVVFNRDFDLAEVRTPVLARIVLDGSEGVTGVSLRVCQRNSA
jgi:hypothetical protein